MENKNVISFFKEQEEQEPEQTTTTISAGGDFINIPVGATEISMRLCLAEYNKLYTTYPNLLNWDIRQIANACKNPKITINDWRNFLLDSRVQKWMSDEQYLKMQAKRNSLLDKVGDNNSTATVQALTAIMKATDDDQDRLEDNHIYIYSFMPLTQEEERLNNAQVLDSIPNEVRAAMQRIAINKDSRK